MRIALVHPFLLRLTRGSERTCRSLADALVRKQNQVDLITWNDPHPVDWGTPPAGARILRMPYRRYFESRWAVLFYLYQLGRNHYDWTMFFFAGYGEADAIALLRRIRPQKYCVQFHFPPDLSPHSFQQFHRLNFARGADHLTTLNREISRQVEQAFGKACAVIPNGVNPELFAPAAKKREEIRTEMGVSSTAPILVTLAALEENKGMQWMIRTLPMLLPRFPDLQYWVLGEGVYRRELESEIRSLGLQAHVRLLGSSNRAADFLAAADIGCLLSRREAFGMAILEYMATGLPVLASAHPPFDEVVNAENGVLVEETNPGAIAEGLEKLLSDPARRILMGQNGRQTVIAHYSWDTMAERYLALWHQE